MANLSENVDGDSVEVLGEAATKKSKNDSETKKSSDRDLHIGCASDREKPRVYTEE